MPSTDGYSNYAFVAELYDYVVPYRDRPDVAFYVEAACESGGPVLELGCGTGRVLIPTARAGIEIVGLDLSSHMLDVCRRHLEAEPKNVHGRTTLIKGDMRQFSLDRRFKLVTIPFRPFQHLLTLEDQLSCLANVHLHLEQEGKLILEIFNPSLAALTRDDIGQEISDEPEFGLPDGRRVKRKSRIVERDLFNQINHVELIYYVTHPDGSEERWVHAFPMRYLFRYEAEHLLHRSGFEVEALFADFEKNPFGSTYPGDLIFIARKR